MKSEEELIEALGGLAMYNDKGIYWTGHSAEQINDTRQSYRARISNFIKSKGRENLSSEALAILESDDILTDDCGTGITSLRLLLKTEGFYIPIQ